MTPPGPICSETDITLLYNPLTVHKKRMAFIFNIIQHAFRSNTNRNSKNSANKQQKFHDHNVQIQEIQENHFCPFLCPTYLPFKTTETVLIWGYQGLLALSTPLWNFTTLIDTKLSTTHLTLTIVVAKGKVWTSEITADGWLGSQNAESILFFFFLPTV